MEEALEFFRDNGFYVQRGALSPVFRLVADLKAIGVGNIILADCVTESKAWYPSKIPGLTHADADVVRSQHRRPAAAQPAAPWPARLTGSRLPAAPAASRK